MVLNHQIGVRFPVPLPSFARLNRFGWQAILRQRSSEGTPIELKRLLTKNIGLRRGVLALSGKLQLTKPLLALGTAVHLPPSPGERNLADA